MRSLSIQLRTGQRIIILDEAGHAEVIDIDNERDERGELVVTDHVLIRNRYKDDGIYDDVVAYCRGEPVEVLPTNTLGVANDNITPALLEAPVTFSLHLVA